MFSCHVVRGVAAVLASALVIPSAFAGDECSFRAHPDRFLGQEARVRFAMYETAKFARPSVASRAAAVVDPAEIPRRNFIDDFIFDEMARKGVKSAALSSDQEFLRRVYYDLTGHPPSPADIRAFLDKPDRNGTIDRLLYTREFMDRWTMWLGDLLQNSAFPANFDRQYFGRNAFYKWMLFSIADQKSLRDIALEAVGSRGNNYDNKSGSANFPLGGIAAMSPSQDTYDNMFMKSASAFLGLSNYDCLLCHDGRNHLEQVNLWASKATRLEAQRQSAFFARISMPKPNLPATDFFYNSYNVNDVQRGFYTLNTLSGNRPERAPIGGNSVLEPEYRDGRKPGSEDWRQDYARMMVDDPLFAVNFANRLWKEAFTMGLVEPVDALDPSRLDPDNPPPGNWGFQPTHPALLRKLATELKERNYNLREFLRLLFESSAYQLSSRYGAEWSLTSVPLFARHYPRRLEGEEIHDSIVMATNIKTNYTLRDLDDTPWAMQMPEPVEPRSNGAAVNFMNPFYRGNRDSFFRIQDGSVQQQLNLMNDVFILNRLRVASSSTLREAAALTNNEEMLDQLFLLFLQRQPDEREKKLALDYLAKAPSGQRNTYIEDLAWSLVNKTDFLFNY